MTPNDFAQGATIWVVLAGSLLTFGLVAWKALTSALQKEQVAMKVELGELKAAIAALAERVEHLVTDVEIIKDRQKRIADKIRDDDDPRE